MTATISAGRLYAAGVTEVLALADVTAAADGHPPLSDHTRLHLDGLTGDDFDHRTWHVRVREGSRLVGYAHVGEGADGLEVEMLVAPGARQQGLGAELLRSVRAAAGSGRLSVWAHGAVPGSRELATANGFHQVRALLQMARPTGPPLPTPVWAPGVSVRTFDPASDGAALLRVNARAFVHHPEQGRWDAADLTLRSRQSWFDPAGIFLAERERVLLGFHWTKRHSPELGEVYVVGVDPAAQGLGLGRALTVVGVRHLVEGGVTSVMLYADADNAAAVGLYRSLGFEVVSTDVRWARDDG